MHRPSGEPHASLTTVGYQDLTVWRTAVDLAVECYLRTAQFPLQERFGLVSQMRRAAVSVVSNIAEGHGRSTFRPFINHLKIARGSVKGLESQFVLAQRLGYEPQVGFGKAYELCDHTSRMISRLVWNLARRAEAAERRTQRADRVIP